MKKVVLIGAGGHARVLIDALRADQEAELCAVVDSNRDLWSSDLDGVPVVGGDECLKKLSQTGATHFVIAMGGLGQAELRRKLFEHALQLGLTPAAVRHPAATCSSRAEIANGVQLLAQCVVNAGATLLENSIINTAAIVEHDCWIDSHAHIAPRACLAGGVHVGTGAHVGLGAVVKEKVRIGEHAVVGAGAVVIQDVPAHSTVVGVPAKPILRKEVA